MSHSGAGHKVSSNTLIPPLHAWQLPQGLVYAVIVAAVAAWSWDFWGSGRSTAIAALTASAVMLGVELALAVAFPKAARAFFGLHDFEQVDRAVPVMPVEDARRDSAAGGAAAPTTEADGPRLEITRQELDELMQACARVSREVDQLVAVSRNPRPADAADEGPERPSDAVPATKPVTPGVLDDATAPAGSRHRRRITPSDVIFGILSVAAATLFVLFVLVLFSA